MIAEAGQRDSWHRILSEAIRRPEELLHFLGLDAALSCKAPAAGNFPLRVPRPFAARMRKGDPADPLLRQVLPLNAEEAEVPGFVPDPLAEGAANLRPGLVHKYRGRALLIAAGACAVHCRYCFRRHFPYADNLALRETWEPALEYIAADADIREVILSGGDPLILRDGQLRELVQRLAAIPHLRRLRLHTRLPIVIPARVTDGLVQTLIGTRLQPAVVLHCNHANEIDDEVRDALGTLATAGIPLLNQAVLLKGVNDCARALVQLGEVLFEARVLPYYLHLPDRVAGTAHFYVGERRARRLLWEAAAALPGYLLPRLMKEVPGAPAKVQLAPLAPRAPAAH